MWEAAVQPHPVAQFSVVQKKLGEMGVRSPRTETLEITRAVHGSVEILGLNSQSLLCEWAQERGPHQHTHSQSP